MLRSLYKGELLLDCLVLLIGERSAKYPSYGFGVGKSFWRDDMASEVKVILLPGVSEGTRQKQP